ncbi:serine/threonine-protein kinase [Anaerolineales bacterium HSG24]|nr:serine/threonine-protein kinase [Anaerolineales bacterium HSG24]
MLRAGDKIVQGEFEIIRPLGQGGFASVYHARDIMLNRHVAIKELRTDKAIDKRNLKRFVQEARATALEHPNIVTIYGMRRHKQYLYIVMEFLPGGTLRDLLNKQPKLPVEQTLKLTIGICEGLARFHDRGIIHRDIKAENILLTVDGRPKVADLGIAHVPESAGGLGMGLTQVGFQPSTLLYSSPEQLRGESLDPRSDVYQVGELLYEMLSGAHYIDIDWLEHTALTHGGNNQARSQIKMYQLLEKSICEDMPSGLKTMWREIGALAGVVETAISKDRDDRFNNTRELAAALNAFSVNTTPAVKEKETPTKQALMNSRAYNKRGLAHVQMRNYEQAVIDYATAIELDANYLEPYHNRSIVHLLMDNYGQALIDCNKAIELAPDFIPAHINRGITYTGLRQYEAALEDYNQVLKLSPQNVFAYYNRANTWLWTGGYEEAIADYGKTILFDDKFVAAYVNRGIAYAQMEKFDLAIIDYNQAIELNPAYSQAYYNRAYAFRKLGENESAIVDYTRVIELNSKHPHVYSNRADAFMAVGNSERFEEDYAKGYISTPSSINPRKLSVARSMLMPASFLDFLTRTE